MIFFRHKKIRNSPIDILNKISYLIYYFLSATIKEKPSEISKHSEGQKTYSKIRFFYLLMISLVVSLCSPEDNFK